MNENNNHNTFYESVTSSGFMPQICTTRYNKRKDKKEKSMTNELLKQINKKNYMYVD